jgi:PAS domain S-box-containing protein
MKRFANMFGSWGLTAKLIGLFFLFGVTPMAIVGGIAYDAGQDLEAGVGVRFQGAAENIADKIDRNLFERYGDVQAFGLNRVVYNRSDWFKTSEETSDIVKAINQYVDTYEVYSLSILVDLDGKVIAVNSRDSDGKVIRSAPIYQKNYRDASWFQALVSSRFTTHMPFTAPGNDTSTGTFIEDLHVDQDVKAAYADNDGLTIAFSAPVYQDGKVIAYWSNRTKFSLVEDIVKAAYAQLKAAGYPAAEMTLMDGTGHVIMNYDPAGAGTENVRHDFNELMKFNMLDAGSIPAKAAVAGQAGYGPSMHIRKQITQTSGYAHLHGVMGYPGMNWSVLIRVPQNQAAAGAWTIKRNVALSALVCLASILVMGFIIGRRTAQVLRRVTKAVGTMAAGQFDTRVEVKSRDEIGQLGNAFNEMGEHLQAADAKINEITNALSKVQAVIEFNLDGTIITANDNFLNTLGYSLDEIKGKHHRMFCEAAYTNSQEYTNFWAKLNRGELDSGVSRRLGKGGKEVWIQASYNPIMDSKGKVYKVAKFATDVTAQKKAQIELETCIAEAQKSLGALAQGDLTQQMKGAYQGELEKIKESINAALTNLTHTITTVRDTVEGVTTGSEQITKGSEDLSQRTSEQASALEETSASMEEMTSTVGQNADNAKQANQLAIAARDIAEKGGSVTVRAVEAMGEINKSSKKIADIITVIDEIAFQTNLLALNAAVEAARAGEHGRGFAVVASEVRNLAQRAATAAKEIKDLINESIQRVTDGSELVNQSGKTLEEIVGSVKRVTDIIAEITAASQEQAGGIDQVNRAIMQMDDATQQNAALVEETTSAAQSMKEQAVELLRQVETFKVSITEGQTTGRSAHEVKRDVAHSMPKPSVKPVSQANASKQASRRAAPAPKTGETKEEVGVGESNGKDRRQPEAEFGEF